MTSAKTNSIIQRAQLEAHWMPYSGNRQFKDDPRIITGAEGVWYRDDRGRQILDGHSGLWTTGLGHGRKEITEAVSQQLATLDYAPPFQFGHPKAFDLANMVKGLMPADLDYVFFTNSGSENGEGILAASRAAS
jgi:beta-alanine--pyruvate transaminase